MAGQVERELLLEPGDRVEVVGLTCAFELFEHFVERLDVSGVVLVVVELQHLGRVVGLERGVVVVEVRQGVLHGSFFRDAAIAAFVRLRWYPARPFVETVCLAFREGNRRIE